MAHDKWTDILCQFKHEEPYLASKVIDWYPSGRTEITAVLTDGKKVAFNSLTGATRKIFESDELLENPVMWKAAFAKQLSRAIYNSGIKQTTLATLVGVSPSSITTYISGTVAPSAYTIAKMAQVLGCSISSLIDVGDWGK